MRAAPTPPALPRPRMRGNPYQKAEYIAGMSARYSCPLCGKMVNRRGTPFRDASQVEAHIDGSHDGAHREERGEDHREEIEAISEQVEDAGLLEPADPSDDPDDSGEDSDDSGEGPDCTGLTVLYDVLEDPNAFGLPGADQVDAVSGSVDDLRDENQMLRDRLDEKDRQIAELYALIDQVAAGVGGVVSGSVEVSPDHRPD